jgi:hypothetical protein
VVEHSHGDLVARVQAGALMRDVQAALAQAGQEIALDVPAGASVGGIVASGLAGPRRLRYGTPRDLLIGITIVRADGTIAKSGGKVVKNVAGYDLGKLFAGSAGTLGLITEATFRLHPLPAARAYVTAEYIAVSVACDAVAAAANSPLVSSAVELTRAEPAGPIQVGVLLEGSADGVAARAARMADLLGKGTVANSAPAWWPGAPRAEAGETLTPGVVLGLGAQPRPRCDRGSRGHDGRACRDRRLSRGGCPLCPDGRGQPGPCGRGVCCRAALGGCRGAGGGCRAHRARCGASGACRARRDERDCPRAGPDARRQGPVRPRPPAVPRPLPRRSIAKGT